MHTGGVTWNCGRSQPKDGGNPASSDRFASPLHCRLPYRYGAADIGMEPVGEWGLAQLVRWQDREMLHDDQQRVEGEGTR